MKTPLIKQLEAMLGIYVVSDLKKVAALMGNCGQCYGKGYGTATLYASSKKSVRHQPTMVFCDCARGKALQEAIRHDRKVEGLSPKK